MTLPLEEAKRALGSMAVQMTNAAQKTTSDDRELYAQLIGNMGQWTRACAAVANAEAAHRQANALEEIAASLVLIDESLTQLRTVGMGGFERAIRRILGDAPQEPQP
jgi:hypothetical protein